MANKKRNTLSAVRWAMSPVLSNLTPRVPDRRRPAQQTTLFPVYVTEEGPKARTGSDLAPIGTGPGGSISGCPSSDCPPALPEDYCARPDESRARDGGA